MEPPGAEQAGPEAARERWRALTLYGRFEQLISWFLTLCITVIILIAAFRLGADVFLLLLMGALDPLEHSAFQAVFGAILTLMIAMEFNHSIIQGAGRQTGIIQVRTVLLIAILALSRKLIILDVKAVNASSVVSLAITVLALGVVHRLLR